MEQREALERSQYYDRTFDLRQLDRMDLLAVYWMGPAIAHMFVNFAFGDQHLPISIEVRKTRDKEYSTIAGFFRQLDRALMLKEYGLRLSSIAGATIGALLVAKVVLVVDMLPMINRFPEKPLVYDVVWKTAIYVVASMVVHYLEHLLPPWWRMKHLRGANEHLWSEIVWPHFWAIQLWLVVLIFIYCTARELIRVIGRDQVRKILFGAPASTITVLTRAKG